MALNITANGDAKLTIKGTSIEMSSAYARSALAAAANGVNMQMGMYYYENAASFEAGNGTVKINEMKPLYNGEADTAGGETQTVLVASEKVKAALEAAGYTVTIVDL